MTRKQKILVAVLGLAIGAYLIDNAFALLPSLDQSLNPNFLQGNYWGDESARKNYEAGCKLGKGRACSDLGYLKEKSENPAAAKALYERACKLGDEYGCKRLKDVAWFAAYEDPFVGVTTNTLANGITLIEKQQKASNRFLLAVEVRAGISDESKEQVGVAHLTEHSLFRDSRLPRATSYFDLVREHGGSMNGYTLANSTVYFASVPNVAAGWLTDQIVQMFDRKTLKGFDIEKPKSEIYLERQIRYPRFFALLNSFFWGFGRGKSFLESEFGIQNGYEGVIQETLSTERLTLKDVNTFYRKHYSPNNMSIYLVGNFDASVVRKKLRAGFGKLKSIKPAVKRTKFKASVRKLPYVKTDYIYSMMAPRIAIGTKYANATAEDVVGMDIYVEYVSHRLMQELRGDQGDTYTAYGTTVFDNFGAALVNFQVKSESLFPYVYAMRQVFRREASDNRITDEQLKEALWLYKFNFQKKLKDVDKILWELQGLDQFRRKFQTQKSPYAVMASLTPKKLRQVLSRNFKPNQEYVEFTNPYAGPIFYLIGFIAFLGPILWMRLKPRPGQTESRFDHLDTTRPIRFGWFVMAAILITFINATNFALSVVTETIPRWSLDLSLYSLIELAISIALVFCWGWCIAQLRDRTIREIGISGDSLVLKTRHLVLHRIPIKDIVNVKEARAHQGFKLATWWQHWPHFELLRRGLSISLSNGLTVFIAPKHLDMFRDKLNEHRSAILARRLPSTLPPSKAVA